MSEYKSKRQYARYRLADLDHATISFQPGGGRPALTRAVFNVSYKGVGFHPEAGDAQVIPVGEVMTAVLRLEKEEISVSSEVLYYSPELAGVRIKPDKSGDIRRIIRFINPMELGSSLQPVDANLIRQKEPKRMISWYVGKNNTELVLWRNLAGELLEFRLVFFLYAIAGNIPKGELQTADLNPVDFGYIPVHEPWPEDVAQWHAKPNREALQLATELLAHAASLSPQDQEEISAWVLGAYPR